LESALKIAAAPAKDGRWTAAALLLQRMPEAGGIAALSQEDRDDVWRTAVILMSSVKDAELLDLSLRRTASYTACLEPSASAAPGRGRSLPAAGARGAKRTYSCLISGR